MTKRYSLADLVEKITPENRHPEVDFGPAVGREFGAVREGWDEASPEQEPGGIEGWGGNS